MQQDKTQEVTSTTYGDVGFGDPKLMGFCPICATNPCNAVNHNFGVCPTCHRTVGYLNVGNDHWFLCHTHKTKLAVGANLFSSSIDEKPEQQREEQEKIGFDCYEKVKPHYDTTGADEEGDGCHCFRCEDSDVKDVQFNDPKLVGGLDVTGGGILVAGETREFYVHPVDDDMIYVDCPLCGSHSCIYGGNRFYTQACCYWGSEDKGENISLQVERWTTEHLLAGQNMDEVHAKLTALRTHPPLRDYVERISAILNDPRTADPYKKYLETGDDGSTGDARQELGYYVNEDSILTAEEDTAHEKAADAAERQDEQA